MSEYFSHSLSLSFFHDLALSSSLCFFLSTVDVFTVFTPISLSSFLFARTRARAQVCGAHMLPVFRAYLKPLFKFIKPSRQSLDRASAIGCLATIVEQLGYGNARQMGAMNISFLQFINLA